MRGVREALGQMPGENALLTSACNSPGEDSLEIILEKKVRVTDWYKDHPNSPVANIFSIFTYFL